MADRAGTPEDLEAAAALIHGWLVDQRDDNPMVDALERDADEPYHWYLRVKGVEKDVFSIWWTLRQRTLHYETYVMPHPEERRDEVFEFVLRRNSKIYGAAFSIGLEDAIFLSGQIAIDHLDVDELDRVLGTLWEWTERTFRPAMRLAFGSRFKG